VPGARVQWQDLDLVCKALEHCAKDLLNGDGGVELAVAVGGVAFDEESCRVAASRLRSIAKEFAEASLPYNEPWTDADYDVSEQSSAGILMEAAAERLKRLPDNAFAEAGSFHFLIEENNLWDIEDSLRLPLYRQWVEARRALTKELTEYAQSLGLSSEDLDETIHDLRGDGAATKANQTDDEDEQETAISTMEREASDINNGGLVPQVQFLLDAVGASEARATLKALAAEK
jgi:hypothetical protein